MPEANEYWVKDPESVARALDRIATALERITAELGKANDALDEIASVQSAADRRARRS